MSSFETSCSGTLVLRPRMARGRSLGTTTGLCQAPR